ncbi:hypothetical protein AAY473_004070 [Plecturocebus cupreus]
MGLESSSELFTISVNGILYLQALATVPGYHLDLKMQILRQVWVDPWIMHFWEFAGDVTLLVHGPHLEQPGESAGFMEGSAK